MSLPKYIDFIYNEQNFKLIFEDDTDLEDCLHRVKKKLNLADYKDIKLIYLNKNKKNNRVLSHDEDFNFIKRHSLNKSRCKIGVEILRDNNKTSTGSVNLNDVLKSSLNDLILNKIRHTFDNSSSGDSYNNDNHQLLKKTKKQKKYLKQPQLPLTNDQDLTQSQPSQQPIINFVSPNKKHAFNNSNSHINNNIKYNNPVEHSDSFIIRLPVTEPQPNQGDVYHSTPQKLSSSQQPTSVIEHINKPTGNDKNNEKGVEASTSHIRSTLSSPSQISEIVGSPNLTQQSIPELYVDKNHDVNSEVEENDEDNERTPTPTKNNTIFNKSVVHSFNSHKPNIRSPEEVSPKVEIQRRASLIRDSEQKGSLNEESEKEVEKSVSPSKVANESVLPNKDLDQRTSPTKEADKRVSSSMEPENVDSSTRAPLDVNEANQNVNSGDDNAIQNRSSDSHDIEIPTSAQPRKSSPVKEISPNKSPNKSINNSEFTSLIDSNENYEPNEQLDLSRLFGTSNKNSPNKKSINDILGDEENDDDDDDGDDELNKDGSDVDQLEEGDDDENEVMTDYESDDSVDKVRENAKNQSINKGNDRASSQEQINEDDDNDDNDDNKSPKDNLKAPPIVESTSKQSIEIPDSPTASEKAVSLQVNARDSHGLSQFEDNDDDNDNSFGNIPNDVPLTQVSNNDQVEINERNLLTSIDKSGNDGKVDDKVDDAAINNLNSPVLPPVKDTDNVSINDREDNNDGRDFHLPLTQSNVTTPQVSQNAPQASHIPETQASFVPETQVINGNISSQSLEFQPSSQVSLGKRGRDELSEDDTNDSDEVIAKRQKLSKNSSNEGDTNEQQEKSLENENEFIDKHENNDASKTVNENENSKDSQPIEIENKNVNEDNNEIQPNTTDNENVNNGDSNESHPVAIENQSIENQSENNESRNESVTLEPKSNDVVDTSQNITNQDKAEKNVEETSKTLINENENENINVNEENEIHISPPKTRSTGRLSNIQPPSKIAIPKRLSINFDDLRNSTNTRNRGRQSSHSFVPLSQLSKDKSKYAIESPMASPSASSTGEKSYPLKTRNQKRSNADSDDDDDDDDDDSDDSSNSSSSSEEENGKDVRRSRRRTTMVNVNPRLAQINAANKRRASSTPKSNKSDLPESRRAGLNNSTPSIGRVTRSKARHSSLADM